MNQKRKLKNNIIEFIIKTKKINKFDFDYKKIAYDILLVFQKEEKIKTDLSVDITISTNLYIKKVNHQFRKINKETDVLSFPMYEKDINTNTLFLGDVIISVDKIFEQSKLYNHSLKREFSFLFCHSLLHLIGYDHIKKNDEKIMIKKQNLILDKLNINR